MLSVCVSCLFVCLLSICMYVHYVRVTIVLVCVVYVRVLCVLCMHDDFVCQCVHVLYRILRIIGGVFNLGGWQISLIHQI